MKPLFEQAYTEKLLKRRAVLFWSGGTESTCLMDAAIKQKLYEICDLTVLMVTFPQELYPKQRIDELKRFLGGYPIHTVILTPEAAIPPEIPYASACGVCKSIRRGVIAGHLDGMLSRDGETVLITGHSLDDLASYTLELIAAQFQRNGAGGRDRFLECVNKFHEFFWYSDKIAFYRPLARIAKQELRPVEDGPLNVIHEKCYWSNQRKRILQSYFESSGIMLSYDRVKDVFLRNFNMPDDDEFRGLPYDTYLM